MTRLAFLLAIAVGMALGGSTQGQTPTAGEYQLHPLKYATASDMERLLQSTLPELGEAVHIAADTRGNQILLRGSQRAQQIARQLIESFDRPKSPTAPSAPDEPPVLRLYPLRSIDGTTAQRRVRAAFPDEKTARVAVEPNSNQLIVVASPKTHQQIGSLLGVGNAADRSLEHPMGTKPPLEATPANGLASPPLDASEFVVRLTYCSAVQAETSLLRILGPRLEPQPAGASGYTQYRLRTGADRSTWLVLDGQLNQITVRGPQEFARQTVRLIQALDGPATATGRLTRIVPVRVANPGKVKQALDAYRGPQGSSTAYPVPAGQPAPGESSATQPNQGRDQSGANARREGGIALVGYIFQPPEGPPPAAAAPKPREAPTAQDQLRELGMDVEVETLPDLDIVILRGRDQDVQELARIIEELERLSMEAEPQVEVYPLKHVLGSALVALIAQVRESLVSSRQGRVAAYSLEKPNALLFIGWGEALSTIKELVEKLDQPVPPETQLRVFPLKHAPSQQTQQTIDQFFGNRQGLGPKLIVRADNRTNALIVQGSPRDMLEVELLLKSLDAAQGGSINQVRMVKVRNVLAADLAATLQSAIQAARGGTPNQRSTALEFLAAGPDGQRLLQSGLLLDVQITADTHNNTLIITGPPENMDLLVALIEQLDTPASVAQIKVFRVNNGSAADLVQIFRSLFPAETGTTQGPSLAGAAGETSLVPLRFSVDSRSNSIIATGSEGDLKIIEALLLRLDERGLEERQNQVYRLKNAPAVQVATAINEFLRSERILAQAAPGTVSPFQRIQSEVVVVPELISNSLILSATPRFFQEISDLIQQLDKEPPQVMIQVLIAEVDLYNTDEFGVELGLQDSVLFDRSLLGNLVTTKQTATTGGGQVIATQDVIQAATNDPGFAFNSSPLAGLPNSGSERSLSTSDNVGPQGLTNFSIGRVNSELGFGGLVLSASSESVSILVRALQESRRLDILSRPQIRTLDNQPAFIQIGERVPRITQSTVTTGGNITNSVVLEEVGLILGVTPRISPDGLVVMEIDAEKSELGPEAEGIPISVTQEGGIIRAPRVKTTTAQATVSASDGETIVLGGLISKTTSNVIRKVPYLADIPLVGSLFRYDAVQGRKKELLIILTPYVIDGPEDNERIRQLETSRMSWCCADVHAMHGVAGLCNLIDCPICQTDVPVYYPDFDPRGNRAGGTSPEDVAPPEPAPLPVPSISPPRGASTSPRGAPNRGLVPFNSNSSIPARERDSNSVRQATSWFPGNPTRPTESEASPVMRLPAGADSVVPR